MRLHARYRLWVNSPEATGRQSTMTEVAMAVNFQGLQLPAGATVDIRIAVTAPVNVTAFTSGRR